MADAEGQEDLGEAPEQGQEPHPEQDQVGPLAAAAIDYASWTVDNARLAVLDAIDARVYADELASRAGA